MKTRLATLTAILATATLALTACAGGSGSTAAQSEQTTQETTASSTRTITDHAGNEVVLPEKITRVAIDQIPIESTYLAYFDGKAPYLVGMSAARVKAMTPDNRPPRCARNDAGGHQLLRQGRAQRRGPAQPGRRRRFLQCLQQGTRRNVPQGGHPGRRFHNDGEPVGDVHGVDGAPRGRL